MRWRRREWRHCQRGDRGGTFDTRCGGGRNAAHRSTGCDSFVVTRASCQSRGHSPNGAAMLSTRRKPWPVVFCGEETVNQGRASTATLGQRQEGRGTDLGIVAHAVGLRKPRRGVGLVRCEKHRALAGEEREPASELPRADVVVVEQLWWRGGQCRWGIVSQGSTQEAAQTRRGSVVTGTHLWTALVLSKADFAVGRHCHDAVVADLR